MARPQPKDTSRFPLAVSLHRHSRSLERPSRRAFSFVIPTARGPDIRTSGSTIRATRCFWHRASSKKKSIGAAAASSTWLFPSRSDCVSCHTEAAGRTIGLELGQLNGDHLYTSTNLIANQLRTLEHIGMFSAPLAKPVAQIVAYPNPTTVGPPLDARARAYLHANCAMCHRPQAPTVIMNSALDLRFALPLKDTKTCGVDPLGGDLIGVTGSKILAPGLPAKSQLGLRPHALDAARMPPLGTSIVDTSGLAVVDAWIASVASCP
jgi:hypothetical protein